MRISSLLQSGQNVNFEIKLELNGVNNCSTKLIDQIVNTITYSSENFI